MGFSFREWAIDPKFYFPGLVKEAGVPAQKGRRAKRKRDSGQKQTCGGI
jgi:hypothetical protein